jgi:hypothetical protein
VPVQPLKREDVAGYNIVYTTYILVLILDEDKGRKMKRTQIGWRMKVKKKYIIGMNCVRYKNRYLNDL